MTLHSEHLLRALSTPPAAARAQLRRVEIELAFAKSLLELHPSDDLGRSLAAAEERFLKATPGEIAGLAERIESDLAAFGPLAKQYTVVCVGHGHIDMNWMWSWPETAAATHDTFASVLRLMELYPQFTFSQSQASVYALVERYYPAMFEQIRARVAEGRWEVAAAHWVEGDKNLASGESLARHLLFTRRYFEDRFGLKPEDVPVDWEPDTFGHANTIPSILAQGAVKYMYCCRPGGGHHHARVGGERPPVFWWEGPDGARVLVNRETTWYNSYVNMGDDVAAPAASFYRQTGAKTWLHVYGVGNHGGGPTRAELDWLHELASLPIYPRLVFGTSKGYFETLESELPEGTPVLAHELNYEFTGCYTSQSAIKRANRFGENFCTEADALLALKPDAGASARLREAWTHVLFNQFHDILPGSGVAATREHALGLFQEVGAVTGAIKRNFGTALTAEMGTASLIPDTAEGRAERERIAGGKANNLHEAASGMGAGLTGLSAGMGGGARFRAYTVFNPCGWERTEWTRVDLYDVDFDPARIVAWDETGAAVPTLFLDRGHEWGHERISLTFPATAPAMGYRTYLFGEGEATVAVPTVRVQAQETFETPDLRLVFDKNGSGLAEVETRASEGWLVSPDNFGRWVRTQEISRGMTAWVLGGNAYEGTPLVGRGFSLRGSDRNGGTDLPGGTSIGYVVEQRLEVPGTKSSVKVRALVHGLSTRIDFEAEMDWREIGDEATGIPGLLVDFEPTLGGKEEPLVFETPFGTVRRSSEEWSDVPSLRFVSVSAEEPSNGFQAFTLLQDSKYGFGVNGCEVQMRVVRSSFDPDHAPEVGKQTLRYATVFHREAPSDAELARLGAAFNHPFLVFPAPLQDGSEATTGSALRVEPADVVLAGTKPGERGGTVLRLVNYADGSVEARVRLGDGIGATSAETVDLLERRVAEAVLADGVLTVEIPGRSFVSVLVR